MWSIDRVRSLLLSASRRLPPHKRTLTGAELGNLLIQLEPGFRPGVLGDHALSALLRRFPDVVRCERGTFDLLFTFFPDSSSEEASAESPLSHSDAATEPPLLRNDVWRAFVHPAQNLKRFIDLESLEIVFCWLQADGSLSLDSAPAAEPDKFLAIPAIEDTEMREVARRFLERVSHPPTDAFLQALEQSSWFEGFCDAARQHGLSDAWRIFQRGFVVERVKTWAEEHLIPFDRLVQAPRPWRGTPRGPKDLPHVEAEPTVPSLSYQLPLHDIEALREMIHQAVAQMSESELLDLRIPLRYLVRLR